jgi:hypothetical protein
LAFTAIMSLLERTVDDVNEMDAARASTRKPRDLKP